MSTFKSWPSLEYYIPTYSSTYCTQLLIKLSFTLLAPHCSRDLCSACMFVTQSGIESQRCRDFLSVPKAPSKNRQKVCVLHSTKQEGGRGRSLGTVGVSRRFNLGPIFRNEDWVQALVFGLMLNAPPTIFDLLVGLQPMHKKDKPNLERYYQTTRQNHSGWTTKSPILCVFILPKSEGFFCTIQTGSQTAPRDGRL